MKLVEMSRRKLGCLKLKKEILLDCYKFVLQNRMLSSGRLGKGSFQEVTDEMNKRCNMQEGFEIGNLAPPSGNLYAAYHMLHIICCI